MKIVIKRNPSPRYGRLSNYLRLILIAFAKSLSLGSSFITIGDYITIGYSYSITTSGFLPSIVEVASINLLINDLSVNNLN